MAGISYHRPHLPSSLLIHYPPPHWTSICTLNRCLGQVTPLHLQAVPSTWNAVPPDLPKVSSFSKLRSQLKDHILKEASPDHLPKFVPHPTPSHAVIFHYNNF